jgi:hypothetical protein
MKVKSNRALVFMPEERRPEPALAQTKAGNILTKILALLTRG